MPVKSENNFIKNPPQNRGIFYFKRLLFCISLTVFGYKSFSQAQINFTETKKKFGFVKKGEVVVLEYEFTNSGNEPLVITDAKAECSCTSIDFPKQPLAPGKKNKITVKFDTKTTYDRQDRIVEIFSNAKNSPANIRFKGVVLNK
jgi:hypothetical protein